MGRDPQSAPTSDAPRGLPLDLGLHSLVFGLMRTRLGGLGRLVSATQHISARNWVFCRPRFPDIATRSIRGPDLGSHEVFMMLCGMRSRKRAWNAAFCWFENLVTIRS